MSSLSPFLSRLWNGFLLRHAAMRSTAIQQSILASRSASFSRRPDAPDVPHRVPRDLLLAVLAGDDHDVHDRARVDGGALDGATAAQTIVALQRFDRSLAPSSSSMRRQIERDSGAR
jgi:hypothetical protein